MSNQALIKVIKRCQKSPAFFCDNFAYVKHPKLGKIPFRLFSYQKKCLAQFLKNKYNIFRKVRQCGASTISGAYALWYGMFHNNKTILIVSKRDLDAMEFLNKHVKFVFDNLPEWMKNLWVVTQKNEHTLAFANGSVIRSLTSSPDTLRSNASSLNIIDEAAFMPHMDAMWASGQPTLQHGGSVICISTANGIGNWYWKTWTEAVDKENDFNPILINWWDMDWRLEFTDELSGEYTIIAPTDRIRSCKDEKEKEKYGPYWSPWLETQYRQLATRGSDHKFRQEILAEFIGTGNTVLSRAALLHVQDTVEAAKELGCQTIGMADYVNPNTGEMETLDFQEEMMIWKPPYTKKMAKKAIETAKFAGVLQDLPEADKRAHAYVIGADTSTGEADDYSSIEVFDIDTQEQVAELKIKALPKTFAKMIDFVGRWYNNAFVVPERTGIGASVCIELDHDLLYPNLYRHKKVAASLKVRYQQIGYPTNNVTKPALVKQLQDNIGPGGWDIKSPRLYHELCIFINLGAGKYGAEVGEGNHDDLTIATALALVGVKEAAHRERLTIAPINNIEFAPQLIDKNAAIKKTNELAFQGGRNLLPPVSKSSEVYTGKPNKQEELAKFMVQLGGIPLGKDKRVPNNIKQETVSYKKHILKYFRK